MPAICPKCHATVPAKDINTLTCVAHCRACGKKFSFTEISSVDADPFSIDLNNPPPSVKIRQDPMDGSFTLIHHRLDSSAFVLIPFTLVFGGAILAFYIGLQYLAKSFNWWLLLFFLPFFIGVFALTLASLKTVFGKTQVHLVLGKGSVSCGWGMLTATHTFGYSSRTSVRIVQERSRNRSGWITQNVIKIDDTDNGTVTVRGNFSEADLPYVAGAIAWGLGR